MMQTENFQVQNVKCGGCVANIENGLAELGGVKHINVDIESGQVTVEGENLDRQQLSSKLTELGYPVA